MCKEIKQCIRDYKANIMMVLFPILLIVILGAAFSGMFDNTIDLSDIKVRYTLDPKYTNTDLSYSLSNFFASLSSETGISFERTEDFETGMADVEDNICAAYIHITGEPLRIDMYKNERRDFTAEVVEKALESFLDAYVTTDVIIRHGSYDTLQNNEYNAEYVQIRALDKKKTPGATDYYAIAMLTMILQYAATTGFWNVRHEIEGKTAARMLCAPVRKYQLLAGKVLGCIFITVIQGFVVLLFSRLILKADWGDDLLTVVQLIISYSIMTVSFGVALAYVFRTNEAGSSIINTTIPIMTFLGGGYVPLYVIGSTVLKIGVISPVKWINSALLGLIYDGSYTGVALSAAINIGLAALFITAAAVLSGRGDREYA